LLLVANGTSTFGRVIPGFLADNYGPLNITAPAGFITMLLLWCWIPDTSLGSLFAFAALFGFFSGYAILDSLLEDGREWDLVH
jgi:MFS family permease